MEFSTSDNDNDEWSAVNCALRNSGANWWKSCGDNNINGNYGGKGDSDWEFMRWYYFDNNDMALKTMTLMFRQTV